MDIKCIQNTDVDEFLRLNEALLVLNESMNNLILGLSNSIKTKTLVSEEPLFFTLMSNDSIVGQAIRTHHNKPLAITEMNVYALNSLIDHLSRLDLELIGVTGPKDSSTVFSSSWAKRKTKSLNLAMNQGIYELVKVIEPNYRNGKIFVATEDHKRLVEDYAERFINDCFPIENEPRKRAEEMTERHLRNSSIYLWQNSEGDIVSMAAKQRESRNAATISLVYTPNEKRGNGYASCLVARLSSKLLHEGKEKCNLVTDLTNPTSNSIYKKIGYKLVAESQFYKFENT